MEQLLYKIPKAMYLLDVSRATVYRMVDRGQLRLVKVGPNSSRITAESIQSVLASA